MMNQIFEGRGMVRAMVAFRSECEHCMWISRLMTSDFRAADELTEHLKELHPFALALEEGT